MRYGLKGEKSIPRIFSKVIYLKWKNDILANVFPNPILHITIAEASNNVTELNACIFCPPPPQIHSPWPSTSFMQLNCTGRLTVGLYGS